MQIFYFLRATRVSARVTIPDMNLFGEIGFTTNLLGLVAASIGEGIVVGSFVVAVVAMIRGRPGRTVDHNALRNIFWGGVGGISCLCFDLVIGSA